MNVSGTYMYRISIGRSDYPLVSKDGPVANSSGMELNSMDLQKKRPAGMDLQGITIKPPGIIFLVSLKNLFILNARLN
jgi:hypothetical protein